MCIVYVLTLWFIVRYGVVTTESIKDTLYVLLTKGLKWSQFTVLSGKPKTM